MSRIFRILQTNHFPDKDAIMEVPDVEKINEISRGWVVVVVVCVEI